MLGTAGDNSISVGGGFLQVELYVFDCRRQLTSLDVSLLFCRITRFLGLDSEVFDGISQIEVFGSSINGFVDNLCRQLRCDANARSLLTLLTSRPDRMTLKQLLITCQLVLAMLVCLRVIVGLDRSLDGVLGPPEDSCPFFSHLRMRRRITAVVELLPLPN